MTEATEQAIQNVSDTAFLVAGFRALESERPQPLFRDPLAGKLAGEHGKKIMASVPKTFGVSPWLVAIRTVTIDDLITKAIGEGVDTVLNLGAGLDTRPYRMPLPPGLRWGRGRLSSCHRPERGVPRWRSPALSTRAHQP